VALRKLYNLAAQGRNALSGIAGTVSCLLWLGLLGNWFCSEGLVFSCLKK